MKRTVILTLGRLPKALDLARGFAALGWRVVVAEPFARHLCGSSRDVARSLRIPAPADGKRAYLEALAAVAREEEADLVVPVSEETMHVAFLPPLLPSGTRVATMLPDDVLALHHKGGFIEAGLRWGLTVPESLPLGDPAAAALAAALLLGEGDMPEGVDAERYGADRFPARG